MRRITSYLYFQIPFNDLAGQTLVLQVFDFDRFGKHDVIGEIKIPMNSIDLGQPIHEWKDLVGGEKEEVSIYCILSRHSIATSLCFLIFIIRLFHPTARKAG